MPLGDVKKKRLLLSYPTGELVVCDSNKKEEEEDEGYGQIILIMKTNGSGF